MGRQREAFPGTRVHCTGVGVPEPSHAIIFFKHPPILVKRKFTYWNSINNNIPVCGVATMGGEEASIRGFSYTFDDTHILFEEIGWHILRYRIHILYRHRRKEFWSYLFDGCCQTEDCKRAGGGGGGGEGEGRIRFGQ